MVTSTLRDDAKKYSGERIMTPGQSRAARAWLGWSQDQLAVHAYVSVNSVRNFESGSKTIHHNTIAALRQAIEVAGIRLLFDSMGGAAGIVRRDADVDLIGTR
jgi:ribosome-binding protein aMBF1 (putative translation factor)